MRGSLGREETGRGTEAMGAGVRKRSPAGKRRGSPQQVGAEGRPPSSGLPTPLPASVGLLGCVQATPCLLAV